MSVVRITAAILLAAALGVSTQAQQFINNFGDGFDPNTGAGDNLWSNPANWNAPIPGPGQVAWINVSSAHDTTPPKQGGPATINHDAGSVSEVVVGQGGGDGHVLMTDGGVIVAGAINIGYQSDRNGLWDQDGGYTVGGDVRIGREDGGTAAMNISGGILESTIIRMSSNPGGGTPNTATSFLNISGESTVVFVGTDLIVGRDDTVSSAAATAHISGGSVNLGRHVLVGATGDGGGSSEHSLTVSGGTLSTPTGSAGNFHIGHRGGHSSVFVTGGTVNTRDVRLSDISNESSATSSLTITGGEFNAFLIGVGARTSSGISGTGYGELTIGGTATVNLSQNMFIRANNGAITIEGSQATITGFRGGASPATGYESHTGTATNFIFDAGGISTVNLNGSVVGSRLQFSNVGALEPGAEPTGVLNVDATAFSGTGDFYLFRFADTIANGVVGAGEFSQHNLLFAPGYAGHVTYIRDQGLVGNGLVLTIEEFDGLPGDLNLDGVVDARDYVLWRKENRPSSEYDQWRANFGASAGSGAQALAGATAVPEPTSLMMMFAAWGLAVLVRSRVPRR